MEFNTVSVSANDLLTFQLEGRLAGPWVQELAECWRQFLVRRSAASVRIDLRAVTFVDSASKDLLAAPHVQDADFLASRCMMKAMVAEVTQASPQSAE